MARLVGIDAGDTVLAAGLAVCGGALLTTRLAGGGPSPLPRPVFTFGAGFLAVSLASAALSVARGETLYFLLRGRIEPLVVNSLGMTAAARTASAVRVFLTILLLLLALDAFSRLAAVPGNRRRLLLAASAGAALSALATVVAPLGQVGPAEPYWRTIGRGSGAFTDPNALGVGLAILLPLAVAALLELPGALRAIPAAALLLAPFALERSGSRTALLAILASAAVAAVGGFRTGGRVRRAVVLSGSAVLLLGPILVAVAPRGGPPAAGSLLHRVGGTLSGGSLVEVTSHRPFFWAAAAKMVAEKPLTGCGLGGFPFEFPVLFERQHGPAKFTDNATNAFLDVAAESGLPALLLAVGAATPLVVLGLETAAGRLGAAGWAAVGGGASLTGLLAASLTGSHLRFPEVALCAAVAAAFLPFPAPASATPPSGPEQGKGGSRVLPVLVFSGVAASLLAAVPTLRPEAAFQGGVAGWIGVYPAERTSAGTHRWTGPLVARRLLAGETESRVTFANARPDGRPVLASFRVNGVPAGSAVVPGEASRTFLVGPLPRQGGVLDVSFSPVFVPGASTRRRDARTLGVILEGDPEGGR